MSQVSGGGGEPEESQVSGLAAGLGDSPHGALLAEPGAGAPALPPGPGQGGLHRPRLQQRGLHTRRQAAGADGEVNHALYTMTPMTIICQPIVPDWSLSQTPSM